MVTERVISNPTPGRAQEFGPVFRRFLVRLFTALLVAGLLFTLGALIGGGFWSYVCAGGGFVILWLIGMDATIRRGEFVRRAGPLPVRRERTERRGAPAERQAS